MWGASASQTGAKASKGTGECLSKIWCELTWCLFFVCVVHSVSALYVIGKGTFWVVWLFVFIPNVSKNWKWEHFPDIYTPGRFLLSNCVGSVLLKCMYINTHMIVILIICCYCFNFSHMKCFSIEMKLPQCCVRVTKMVFTFVIREAYLPSMVSAILLSLQSSNFPKRYLC